MFLSDRHATSSDPAVETPWSASVSAERALVVAHDVLNIEYRRVTLSCSDVAARAEPGQFFQILCPHSKSGRPFLRRPMSVYEVDPIHRRVSFLYKIVGTGTRGLATVAAGDTLDVVGPLGRGFSIDPSWRHVVAVGRGAGLATLAPVAATAAVQGTRVTALLSARRPDLIVSAEVFQAYGADVMAVTDAEATSGPANVERLLRDLIARGRCDAFLTCGSSRLLGVQQRLAREFGLPGQVALEQQMACGFGACFCCVRNFFVAGEHVQRRVCWDGPVFDIAEALP